MDSQEQLNLRLLEGRLNYSGTFLILASNRVDVPTANQLFLFDIQNNEFLGIGADIGRGIRAFQWNH
jgi:hypothetical protein